MAPIPKTLPILLAVTLLSCSTQDQPIMEVANRWSAISQLKGWKVCRNYDESVKKAHMKRHPKHDSYIPISETKPLNKSEAETYERLNEKLHDELRQVSRNHFENEPVPKMLQKNNGSSFTPFTYQNYDWYGPSYECYILVITDYISADLLLKFQTLLREEHRDWCIRVVGAYGPDFDGKFDIAIFSDEIIISKTAEQAMRVPELNRDNIAH